MVQMGFQFGLENKSTVYKFTNRWLFSIDGVSAGDATPSSSVNVLPPKKSARPNISIKEIQVEHKTETIYFPGKPDWGTVNLTLYDLKCNKNIVFDWLKKYYDPQAGVFNSAISMKKDGTLTLYNGCGDEIEKWIYDKCWPQKIEWGELDMDRGEVLYADMTLRFDRAYFISD